MIAAADFQLILAPVCC